LPPEWSLEAVPGLIDLRGEPVAAKQLVTRSLPASAADGAETATEPDAERGAETDEEGAKPAEAGETPRAE
jgi:hypothetical protein